MHGPDVDLPSIAEAFIGRARSFASGVAWGHAFGLTGTPPTLDQKTVGPSLTQFESGAKIGIAEGLALRRKKVGQP